MNLRPLLLVLGFFSLDLAFGQVNAVSPYSRYGVGDPGSSESVQSLGMGGIGSALKDPYQINLLNPASLMGIRLTSIEVAMNHTEVRQETSLASQRNSVTGFSYLTVAIPSGKHLALALGAKPFTSMGYNISTAAPAPPGIGSVVYNFTGTGGINQAFGSVATQFKGLSLGVEVSYLFGKLTERQITEFDSAGFFDVWNSQERQLKGFQFNLGAQYEKKWKSGFFLNLGGTFQPIAELDTKYNEYAFTFDPLGGNSPFKDTLVFTEDQTGINLLAPTWTAGFMLGKRVEDDGTYAWSLGADVRQADWAQFRSLEGASPNLQKATRFGVGFSMVPNAAFESLRRKRNYLGDIQYRLGGFWEDSPLKLRNTVITNYGMTFGMGLPIKHRQMIPGEEKSTVLNFGLAYGSRGTLNNGLIQETYVRFLFGITLNDRWFIKYKYR
jgi:hypothetical protein